MKAQSPQKLKTPKGEKKKKEREKRRRSWELGGSRRQAKQSLVLSNGWRRKQLGLMERNDRGRG